MFDTLPQSVARSVSNGRPSSGRLLVRALLVALGVVAVVGATGSASAATPDRLERAWSPFGPLDVVSRTPSSATTGRVSIDAPGRLVLDGSYTTTPNGFTITVDDVDGSLAGVTTRAARVRGSIVSANGRITSDVTVTLPRQPQMMRGWTEVTRVSIAYSASAADLVGRVTLRSTDGSGRLVLTGPVIGDGYRLRGDGRVSFGGSSLPVEATYAGSARRGSPTHSWSVSGDGSDVAAAGAVLDDLELSGSQSTDGLQGTGVLAMPGTLGVRIAVDVDYANSRNWRLAAAKSDIFDVTVARVPGLLVRPGDGTGSVVRRRGVTRWDLDLPMQVPHENLTLRGVANITGLDRFVIRPSSASGSVLGTGVPATFDEVGGSVTVDSGSISGTMRLRTVGGDTLVGLPMTWRSAADLRITFSAVRGGALSTYTDLEYAITNGPSRLVLSGGFSSSDGFQLEASGQFTIADTAVPFSGVYQSKGFRVGGVALTEPQWNISGDVSSVAGGVQLPGGGSIVGGRPTLVGSSGSVNRVLGAAPSSAIVGRSAAMAASGTPEVAAASTCGDLTGSVPAGTVIVDCETQIILANGDPFTVKTTTTYQDSDTWTATVTPTNGTAWSPTALPGLSIPLQNFTGTISSDNGKTDWEISVTEVTWTNITSGVTLTTDFSIGSACPLDENCPTSNPNNAVFFGFTGGSIDFPSPWPDSSLDGAFLADGSWARFDAAVPDFTTPEIEVAITNAGIAMWKGTRTDSFDPNLDTPDLSTANNGFNIEFCGNFEVEIPDIKTLETGGCVTYTPSGFTIGQASLGGSVDTAASSGGVDIGITTLTGWAWTNLSTFPQMTINKIPLVLQKDLQQLGGDMNIPGNILKELGLGDIPKNFPAQGWVKSTDFDLSGEIPVNLKASGVTFQSLVVGIGKEGKTFTLEFGAKGNVALKGNQFPIEAMVELAAGGGNNEVSISIEAKGTTASDTRGTFDLPTLLAEADFEPVGQSSINGDFDAKRTQFLDNGGFENAKDAGNVLTNDDFETDIQGEMIVNGDFESGQASNMLANADFEETNAMNNGDFETGDGSWWGIYGGYDLANVATSAPTVTPGTNAFRVRNASSSANPAGLYQIVSLEARGDRAYTMGAWIRSDDGSNRSVRLTIAQIGNEGGCTSGDNVRSKTVTATTSWQYFEFKVMGDDCKTGFRVHIDPTTIGSAILIDDVTLRPDKNPLVNPDFEAGVTENWGASSGYAMSLVSGDGAPEETSGNASVQITNNTTTNTGFSGLSQGLTYPMVGGQKYTLSLWARSPSSAPLKAWMAQTGTRSGCSSSANDDQFTTFTTTPDWKQYTFQITGNGCKTGFTLALNPTNAGSSVVIDSVSLTTGTYNWLIMPNQPLPTLLNTFDLDPITDYVYRTAGGGNVSRATDYGNPGASLRSDGNGDWWQFKETTFGNIVNSDFDVSFDVFFPNSGSRDIMNMGFYLNPNNANPNGYAVRLQSATGNNNDSGFWTVSNGNVSSRVSGQPNWGAVARNTWYRVSLKGYGGNSSSLRVWRISDGAEVVNYSVTLPGGNRSGVFGQIKDGAGASEGSRVDNFRINHTGNFDGYPRVANVPGVAHTGDGYLVINPPADRSWSLDWSLGETPQQNKAYSVSAWVRSPSGSMPGLFYINTDGGGNDEYADVDFTATSTWKRVTTTLWIQRNDQTDLQFGFSSLSRPSAGAEFQIDDIVVQEIPNWKTEPIPNNINGAGVAINTEPGIARSGIGALEWTSTIGTGSGSLIRQNLPTAPQQNSTYTLTAWVKSKTPVSGYMVLESNGGTYESGGADFTTVADTWTKVTVTKTWANSGHTSVDARINLVANNSGNPLYIDDMSVTVTNYSVSRPASEGWLQSTTVTSDNGDAWLTKSSDVTTDATIGNPGSSIRSDGSGSWWYLNGIYVGDFQASYDVYFPAGSGRDIANFGFWLTGTNDANMNGYFFRLQTAEQDAGFYQVANGVVTRPTNSEPSMTPVATNTWYRVFLNTSGNTASAEVRRISDNALMFSRTTTLPAGNRAGTFGEKPDGAASTGGHRWDNIKFSAASLYPFSEVRANATNARGGAGYLSVSGNTGNSARMDRTVTLNPAPVAGNTYSFGAWVKTASGTANGKLWINGASTNFTANTTWQQIWVETTLNNSNPVTIGLEKTSGGTAILSDDWQLGLRGLTQPQPWVAQPASGGTLPLVVWNIPSTAHSGDNLLEAIARTAVPASLYIDAPQNKTINPGTTVVGSMWVKTGAGLSQTVGLTLEANGGTAESRSRNFTINQNWQRLWVELPQNNSGHNSYRLKLTVNDKDESVYVDDAVIEQLDTWGGKVGTVDAIVTDGKNGETAAQGSGFLRMTTGASTSGVWAMTSGSYKNGSSYTFDSYVKVPSGSNLTGRMRVKGTPTTGGGNVIVKDFTFSANTSWQWVGGSFSIAQDFSALVVEVLLDNAGTVDVDQIALSPDIIVQNDPWTNDSGGKVTVLNRPDRAYMSSGVMVVETTGSGAGIVSHKVATTPTAGNVYDVSAWVRSSTGKSLTGKLEIVTYNASNQVVQTFPIDISLTNANWKFLNSRITLGTTASTMRARITLNTTGVPLDVDNVAVQQPVWTSFGGATQVQTNDQGRTQSGSGYLKISKTASSDAGVSLTSNVQMANGSTYAGEIWVRSSDGTAVAGRLRLTGSGGTGTDVATTSFTAGADWQKVLVTLPITTTGRNSLKAEVFVDTANKGLDVDTYVNGAYPFVEPDGINNELPNPNSGYVYLWDDAFGIPGAHLWAISAEVSFTSGSPGLGVAATMYLDPTKLSSIMTGTDWIKGSMALNISRSEPCLSFGFDARSKNSGVRIDGGVFTTKQFQVNFAPRGCEIGSYVVPQGTTIGFDTSLGDANFHLVLEATRDEDDKPRFYGEIGLTNLELAGTTYNSVLLSVLMESGNTKTSMVADLSLPMGEFYAAYELNQGTEGIAVSGDVSVTDWTMAGGTFDVSSFNYSVDMDVPFGAGSCATLETETDGVMSMGKKNYQFDGEMVIDCGELQILNFHYLYWKGGTSFDFYIDYDKAERELAGGLGFDFNRKFSWKFLGKKYQRHPKFMIDMDFWMPIDNPSKGTLTLKGLVSVASGEGSVDCTFSGSGDDSCSLYAKVKGFWGTKEYRSSW